MQGQGWGVGKKSGVSWKFVGCERTRANNQTTSSAVQNPALTENAKSRILYSMSIVSELHDINRRLQSLEKLALELRGYL